MNTLKIFFITFLFVSLNLSGSSQTKKEDNSTTKIDANQVEVYYFHYTRRCATCNAVESVSKEAVSTLYGDKVSFADFNLDEEAGKTKGKELEVSGQTLLIVSGDIKINITEEGFMNARSNPEKLKSVIKEKIDGLID